MQEYLLIPSLFLIGFVGGAIGTVAGGSVLMTAPLLASFGMPLQDAIATSRVSSFGIMGAGLRQFHKAGQVEYRVALEVMFWSVFGSILGAYVMLGLSDTALKKVVGWLMLFMLGFSLVKDYLSFELSLHPSLRRWIGSLLFFCTGVLAGFFGGQAIIASFLLLHFFDISPYESIGTRKAVGLVVALTSIVIYASFGTIDWLKALYLLSGSCLGATISAKWALRQNEALLKHLINAAIALMALRMLLFS